jgi:glucokinase
MSKYYLGIDLGGTNLKVGCFDSELNQIAKTSNPTYANMGPEAVIDTIEETTKKLLSENNLTLDDIISVGIGSPGPADISEGIVISAPNLPEFKNVPLRQLVSERLGKDVVFENDANAACWGEYVVGAGRGVKDMIFFTLGTGIGGGIISNGELVHGFKDNAAELGHMIIYPHGGRFCGCGQRGCVEAYASASSTARRATEAIQAGTPSSLKKVYKEKGHISCKNVFDHAAEGDKFANEITKGTAEALGILCVNIIHITGPQRVVFAGGMIAAGEPLLKSIKKYFNYHIWPLKQEKLEICFATLGEDAGIIGTAALAVHQNQKQRNEKSSDMS